MAHRHAQRIYGRIVDTVYDFGQYFLQFPPLLDFPAFFPSLRSRSEGPPAYSGLRFCPELPLNGTQQENPAGIPGSICLSPYDFVRIFPSRLRICPELPAGSRRTYGQKRRIRLRFCPELRPFTPFSRLPRPARPPQATFLSVSFLFFGRCRGKRSTFRLFFYFVVRFFPRAFPCGEADFLPVCALSTDPSASSYLFSPQSLSRHRRRPGLSTQAARFLYVFVRENARIPLRGRPDPATALSPACYHTGQKFLRQRPYLLPVFPLVPGFPGPAKKEGNVCFTD